MKNVYIRIVCILVLPLVAQAGDHNSAYALVAEYTSSSRLPNPVYAIDIDENHQYLVATSSKDHQIKQYALEQQDSVATDVKKIYPNYVYQFPSLRDRSEYYIRCGSGKSDKCFYVHGLTGAWFEQQNACPLGTTKDIESETVLLWDVDCIDENSRILVGASIIKNTLPAVKLNRLKGDLLRTYFLNNNVATQPQVSCLTVSSDKKDVVAGISGQLLCAFWNFETGASVGVVKNNQDKGQLCLGIVSIPKKNTYCIGSLDRLMRYDVNSNKLDTMYTLDDNALSGMVFLDDNTLVVGSYSGVICIFDLRKLDNQPIFITGTEGVAINTICALSNSSFLTSRDDGVVAQWQAQ